MNPIQALLALLWLPLLIGCERHEPPATAASDTAKTTTAAVDAPPPSPAPAAPAETKKTPDGAETPAESETENAPAGANEKKAKPKKDQGISLFNGKNLKGWKEVNFGGEGEIVVEDGNLILGAGESMTAILYDGKEKLPTMDYEISLEANKLMGNDFFCGLTFPVRDKHATLIVGGWGGAVVGVSSIDGFDASENETAQFMAFDTERWYKIRLRVADERIAFWIDGKELTDLDIRHREVDMRPGEIELCVPLGIASYQTRSALRNIRLKKLPSSDDGF